MSIYTSYEPNTINSVAGSTCTYTFHITGIYPCTNMPDTLQIYVWLHWKCSPLIDPTLLHIQVKKKNCTFIYYVTSKYVPATNMPIKFHLYKFPNCLVVLALDSLNYCSEEQAQHMQDCPILFIQLNYVHNKKIGCCHFMLNSPATRWHQGFNFLLINEAMQGKH